MPPQLALRSVICISVSPKIDFAAVNKLDFTINNVFDAFEKYLKWDPKEDNICHRLCKTLSFPTAVEHLQTIPAEH